MTLDQFIDEAQALRRSGVVYRRTGVGEPVAYWYGFGSDSPVISLNIGTGWLEVFTSADGCRAELAGAKVPDGVPLFAEVFTSLPPVDAVFQRGSDRIGDFLNTNKWPRNEFYNDNFPSSIPREYEKLWWASCPMGMSEVVAASGGWPFPWPDSEIPQTWNNELVLWTLQDSEPWIEVYKEGDGYATYERIT
jgi:hypothetical protein